jgi:hypothetical protein
MKAVSPVLPDQPDSQALEVKVAESQDEYQTLPALLVGRYDRRLVYVDSLERADYVIARFELSDEEIARINETRCLYYYQHNFGRPLQPLLIETESPAARQPHRSDQPTREE